MTLLWPLEAEDNGHHTSLSPCAHESKRNIHCSPDQGMVLWPQQLRADSCYAMQRQRMMAS